jgi:hypothetical protein
VLCPSTLFFLLSLITYILGMIKFNVMHKDDIWLVKPGLTMMSGIIITWIDWRHIFVSLHIFAPMNIWSASMISAVLHLLFKLCFLQRYEKFREAKRKEGGKGERRLGRSKGRGVETLRQVGKERGKYQQMVTRSKRFEAYGDDKLERI